MRASQGQTAQLRATIQAHRASFINESDFADMAASGINAVRIPVGYWALEATAVSRLAPPHVLYCVEHSAFEHTLEAV